MQASNDDRGSSTSQSKPASWQFMMSIPVQGAPEGEGHIRAARHHRHPRVSPGRGCGEGG